MKLKSLGLAKKKGPAVGAAADLPKKPAYKADPKGMRCPNCKSPGYLVGVCKIRVLAPLAKGGSIKVAGMAITQPKLKEHWQKQATKEVRCMKCENRFTYVDGEGLQEYAG